jgi:hypothetical protein
LVPVGSAQTLPSAFSACPMENIATFFFMGHALSGLTYHSQRVPPKTRS